MAMPGVRERECTKPFDVPMRPATANGGYVLTPKRLA
jgi:hypothetical protein